MQSIPNCVVRLTVSTPDGEIFGTGVIISETSVLSARHVLDPAQMSLEALPPQPDQVAIWSRAYMGARTPDVLHFPSDLSIDLGLAILRPPKEINSDFRCPVWRNPSAVANVGDKVQVCGFASTDGDIYVDELRIISVHGNAGAYICNKFLPQGFSGGPVFSEDALIGIMYARNQDQNISYFHGGHALLSALSEFAPNNILWSEGQISSLRQYPLGPAVQTHLTSARLRNVILACVVLYAGAQAHGVIDQANSARLECGPETGDAGIIKTAFLVSPFIDPYLFWLQAFQDAGLKSPRMLAALLQAVDTDRLEAKPREEKESMLRFLASLTV